VLKARLVKEKLIRAFSASDWATYKYFQRSRHNPLKQLLTNTGLQRRAGYRFVQSESIES
jgi:hypothetical protein